MKFRCKSINLSLYKVNLVRRILGEFTGAGSMGSVEVVPVMVNHSSTNQQPRRKLVPHLRRKRKPASESMTADVVPVLANTAPELMAKLRYRLNNEKDPQNKSAIESILGESDNEPSLIPDDADKLLTTKEVEDEKKTIDNSITLGKEDLLQTALALVAPDTTPNSAHELDPSLVPNRDPALSTILGENPRMGPTSKVKTESFSPKNQEVETKIDENSSLPSFEMPRPPGDFLRSIGDITGEGREEKPKVELVVGNSSSPVGSAVSEGMLGASEMPTPKESNIDRTMDAFRRFHRVKI